MKSKILNLILILSSLIGYLEWGGDNSMFIFQGELEIFSKLLTDPTSVAHPFIFLPFIGQVLLFLTLFQKQPSKKLTFMGLGGIGILLSFMFLIGLISLNFKILVSTLPFFITGILVITYYRKRI